MHRSSWEHLIRQAAHLTKCWDSLSAQRWIIWLSQMVSRHTRARSFDQALLPCFSAVGDGHFLWLHMWNYEWYACFLCNYWSPWWCRILIMCSDRRLMIPLQCKHLPGTKWARILSGMWKHNPITRPTGALKCELGASDRSLSVIWWRSYSPTHSFIIDDYVALTRIFFPAPPP